MAPARGRRATCRRSYAPTRRFPARSARLRARLGRPMRRARSGVAHTHRRDTAMETLLTRRECGRCLAGALALLGGGCATMSPSEERRLGSAEAEEVERTMGFVRD